MTPVAASPWRRALAGAAGLVAFVLLWKAAGTFEWVRPGTVPDPFVVPRAAWSEIASGRLLPAVGSSLVHYVWGLAIGSALGVAVGLGAATLVWLDAGHAWLARILRPIPPLAWVVFAIAWFKVSHAGAAFVIAIGVFWVNYFATYAAIRNIDPRYHELARAFGHGGYLKLHGSITVPAAAPGIFSGLRTGVGQAWMTLIAAELLGVPGMGQEMNAAAGVGAYDAVVVYMLTISVVYTASDFLFSLIERKALAWRPVLTAERLTLRFPGATDATLQDFGIEILPGAFVAIVGGSGVGKSTLLRAIAGLLRPETGRVALSSPERPGQRRRAIVFQDGRLLPWRTLRRNVAYGLEGLGLARDERRARVDEVLRLTRLDDLADRYPHQLSGGQVQRGGIARALAVRPDVLLMDEPFSAVDALTRGALQDELLRIWKASGAAILFVTHDIAEAALLSQRVVVLSGQPARIALDQPVDLPLEGRRAQEGFAPIVERIEAAL